MRSGIVKTRESPPVQDDSAGSVPEAAALAESALTDFSQSLENRLTSLTKTDRNILSERSQHDGDHEDQPRRPGTQPTSPDDAGAGEGPERPCHRRHHMGRVAAYGGEIGRASCRERVCQYV